jgi:protein-disulfide isomerase
MNTNRIIFWASFIIIIALIIWGLVVAMNKPINTGKNLGTPSEVTTNDNVKGSADAKVTIIEYSDFQCPACAAYYSLVNRLIDEASTTVRFVYRHFPLFPLPHKNAFIASQASEAAAMQGKFWDMYQLLFENQTAWENSNTAKAIFEGYAERIGLNIDVYKKDFDSTEVKARIQRDKDEGDELGVAGTPTFFINGKAITNPNGYEEFKKIIDAATLEASN